MCVRVRVRLFVVDVFHLGPGKMTTNPPKRHHSKCSIILNCLQNPCLVLGCESLGRASPTTNTNYTLPGSQRRDRGCERCTFLSPALPARDTVLGLQLIMSVFPPRRTIQENLHMQDDVKPESN